MPRTRQYQAPSAPNAQAYGQRGDQIAAQQAMPLPQAQGAPSMPQGVPSGPPPIEPGLIEQAAAFDPQITPLAAPSSRPGEPVTAGLSRGAGVGPEALVPGRKRSEEVARTLRLMRDLSGDDLFSDLADRLSSFGGQV